ncbi:hypothetical protein [Fodinicola acaciae]|uniref:hypothetical protein n=1 Tax=Fodinicola acaciae TaxID=2681555 RepID=UPI0013D2EE8F|nr:hypothetical protein [Fodinicola acaciae]
MVIDSGGIDMAAEDTRYDMTILAQAGQDLTTQWSAAHPVISAAGQVGADLLAGAFIRTYQAEGRQPRADHGKTGPGARPARHRQPSMRHQRDGGQSLALPCRAEKAWDVLVPCFSFLCG